MFEATSTKATYGSGILTHFHRKDSRNLYLVRVSILYKVVGAMGAVIGSLAGVIMMSKFNISVRKGAFG